jgi:hypothetical protein
MMVGREKGCYSHFAPACTIALLGSFKALFDSYEQMHESKLPIDFDVGLILRFLKQLLLGSHYVVRLNCMLACGLATLPVPL